MPHPLGQNGDARSNFRDVRTKNFHVAFEFSHVPLNEFDMTFKAGNPCFQAASAATPRTRAAG